MSKKMKLGLAFLFVGAVVFTSIFTACTQDLLDSILGDGTDIGDSSGDGSGDGSGGDSGGGDSGVDADAAITQATNAINAANQELSTIDKLIQDAQAAKQQAETDNNNITETELKADTKITEADTKITEALAKKADLETLIQDTQAKKAQLEGTKTQENIDNLNNAVQAMNTSVPTTKTTAQDAKTKADYAQTLAYSGYVSETLKATMLVSGQTYTLEKDTDIYNWKGVSNILGTFDGNGKTLTIKSFSETATDNQKTLGEIIGYSGHVKNLTLRIEQDINFVGDVVVGLVTGWNRNKITNVHVKGSQYTITTIAPDFHAVGGIVGQNDGNGIIEDSSSEVNIVSTATTEFASVGGLVGTNFSGSITRSYATGNITAIGKTRARAGGLVGYSPGGTITSSYATGNVTLEPQSGASGSHLAGGFIGESGATITDSYSTGSVSANDVSSPIVGGFAGKTYGTLTNVYSTANTVSKVKSGGEIGRFAGLETGGTITNAFVKNIASPSENIGSGAGTVTVISEGPASEGDMSGFDFASVWTFVGGAWPKLSWQP